MLPLSPLETVRVRFPNTRLEQVIKLPERFVTLDQVFVFLLYPTCSECGFVDGSIDAPVLGWRSCLCLPRYGVSRGVSVNLSELDSTD